MSPRAQAVALAFDGGLVGANVALAIISVIDQLWPALAIAVILGALSMRSIVWRIRDIEMEKS